MKTLAALIFLLAFGMSVPDESEAQRRRSPQPRTRAPQPAVQKPIETLKVKGIRRVDGTRPLDANEFAEFEVILLGRAPGRVVVGLYQEDNVITETPSLSMPSSVTINRGGVTGRFRAMARDVPRDKLTTVGAYIRSIDRNRAARAGDPLNPKRETTVRVESASCSDPRVSLEPSNPTAGEGTTLTLRASLSCEPSGGRFVQFFSSDRGILEPPTSTTMTRDFEFTMEVGRPTNSVETITITAILPQSGHSAQSQVRVLRR